MMKNNRTYMQYEGNQIFPMLPRGNMEEKPQTEQEKLEIQATEHLVQSMIQLNNPEVRAKTEKQNF